ncbi:MAG: hypothetical protein ACUVUC_00720 [Thermoguttaceae bacterium]
MGRLEHVYRELMRMVNRLDAQEWLLILAGVVVVGWVCLRGFGSRSSY